VAAFLEREALKARLLALFSKQRDDEAEARKASELQRALPEWIVICSASEPVAKSRYSASLANRANKTSSVDVVSPDAPRL
jgi:hypothetical protein